MVYFVSHWHNCHISPLPVHCDVTVETMELESGVLRCKIQSWIVSPIERSSERTWSCDQLWRRTSHSCGSFPPPYNSVIHVALLIVLQIERAIKMRRSTLLNVDIPDTVLGYKLCWQKIHSRTNDSVVRQWPQRHNLTTDTRNRLQLSLMKPTSGMPNRQEDLGYRSRRD